MATVLLTALGVGCVTFLLVLWFTEPTPALGQEQGKLLAFARM